MVFLFVSVGKYHRGNYNKGQWVFGGVERGTNRCFLVIVPDRKRKTLLAIIKQYIAPGTTIISDEWRAYRCLG
jgi:transposase-like protein